jgi:pyruvate dehydrogenase E2 component (dihydrolipoamide acetyltransferase)
MAEAVLMMALSPTMDEGVIAEWITKEGQTVKSGDVLCEVETDKATMAYEASSAGTLLKILKPAGSKAAVGDPIAVLGKAGEDWQSAAGALTSAVEDKAGTSGAQAATQAPEIPSLPASQPASQPATQTASQPVGQTVSQASSQQATQMASQPESRPASETGTANNPVLRSGYPPSSPLARNKAAEAGLDIRAVRGSGPKGRVVARDVAEALKTGINRASLGGGFAASSAGGPAQPGVAGGKSAARSSAQSSSQAGTKAGLRDERVSLSRMRSIIADRLSASYSTAPHFFVRAAVDMENLVALRASLNAGRDHGLGLNAFIMKLVASALEHHPVINASWEGDAIRFRGGADIGLAVALEGGLITPVVRSCENLGIAAIDAALADLVPRARSGTLTPQEYSEASFTISNLGSYGIEEFTAIINPPGSAILALGGMAEEAVVRDGAIVARRIMHITLSCDHRVIDGAAAAAFMAELKAMMEEPARALL